MKIGWKHITELSEKKIYLLLFTISVLLFANTLGNQYALDDTPAIKRNAIVTKGISAIPELMFTPYHRGFYVTSNDLYRPLSLVMFATEYELFGLNPFVGHLINILVFALSILVLYRFLISFFGSENKSVVLLGCILFVVHPIHTEVVANIKSRDELLCFLFAFVSLNFTTRYFDKGRLWSLVFAVLFYWLSLLAKETSISLLAIVPLCFLVIKKSQIKRGIVLSVTLALAAGAYLYLRYTVLAHFDANHGNDIKFIDNILAGAPNWQTRVATALYIMGNYVRLLIIPYPLLCDYSYAALRFHTLVEPTVWLAAGIYLFTINYAAYLIWKKQTDLRFFSLVFFVVTVALFTNLFFLIGAAMAERFLFFPSVGYCLFFAFIVDWFMQSGSLNQSIAKLKFSRNTIVPWGLVVLVVCFAVLTVKRNAEWYDNVSLYSADIQMSPDNARLYYFLGNTYVTQCYEEAPDSIQKRQFLDKAIANLSQSVRQFPRFEEARKTLGTAFFYSGNTDSAIIHLSIASQLDTMDLQCLANLDAVYFAVRNFDASIATCKKMIYQKIDYAPAYSNIGICFMHMKKYDSSIFYLKQGIEKNKKYIQMYENIALAYKLSGQLDSASLYTQIVQQTIPQFHLK